MHILYIEPDQITARQLREFCAARGHELFHAVNAQSALHILDEQVIDIIVLEPKLARHNGIEFLYELRSYHDLETLPLIVYSSLPPALLILDDAARRQLGVRAVLYKTDVTMSALVQHLERTVPAEVY